jgi:protocatechuate 3,4-dioxygenase beta subunit
MKKPIIGAVVVVLGIAGFFLFKSRGGGDSKETETAAPAPEPSASRPARTQPQDMPELSFLMDDDVEGTLRLEGQVVDANKIPIGGAIVTLDSNPPRTATSEDDGSFYFDKLVGRAYTLIAQGDGGVAGPVTARLTDGTEPVILIVRPAASVEVKVLSAADRKPIAGATVEVRGLVSQTGTTGDNGVARIKGVPADGYQVVARADGYAQTATWMRVGGEEITETIELSLRRGAPVAGRVIDPDGAALAGAVVLYSGASDWSQQANARWDGVVSDDKGEFRIDGLPEGTFRFRARHEEFAPGLSEPITLDGRNERTGVVVQMEQGAVIAGVVIDEQSAPVPGAAVRVSLGGPGMRFERPRQTYSDDDGKFEMRALPRREIDIVAVHEVATSETESANLEATPEKRDFTLKLDVDGVVAGVVVDSEGEPVEGAQVLLWPDFRRGDGGSGRDFRLRGQSEELTDAGGRFEFRGLQDMPYQVRANPPGVAGGRGRAFMREGTPAQVGDTELRIVLEKDGTIRGKVAFQDGEVPEAFTVSLGGFRGGTPFSTEDGSFSIADVPANTYTITVRGIGFDQAQKPDVEVASGADVDLGTITVTKGRAIEGRVVTAQREPVPGASVTVGRMLFGSGSSTTAAGRFGPPGTQRNKTVVTGDDGSFIIRGVAASDLNIVAEHETLGRTVPVAIPGSRESTFGLELVMQPTGALEGIVTMGGKPAESVRISCQSQSVPGAIFGVATGDDGKFRFDKLSPGSYMVAAMTGGNPMRGMGFHDGKQVVIASEKTSTVRLEIGEGNIELLVNLKPKSGEVSFAGIFTVQTEVTATNAKELQIQTANRDGGFSSLGMSINGRPALVENLSPGDYTVCAAPYPTEVQGMQPTLDYMEREGDSMPIFCAKTTVAAEPARQEVTIPVQVPEFVPAS